MSKKTAKHDAPWQPSEESTDALFHLNNKSFGAVTGRAPGKDRDGYGFGFGFGSVSVKATAGEKPRVNG